VEKVALATLAGRTPSAEDARPARGGVVQREARRLTSHRPGWQATGWEAVARELERGPDLDERRDRRAGPEPHELDDADEPVVFGREHVAGASSRLGARRREVAAQ
jgi:hypothetical protein